MRKKCGICEGIWASMKRRWSVGDVTTSGESMEKQYGVFTRKQIEKIRGYHVPLEICDTCPVKDVCKNAYSSQSKDRTNDLKRAFDKSKLDAPVYFYDNPYLLVKKLGFVIRIPDVKWITAHDKTEFSSFARPIFIEFVEGMKEELPPSFYVHVMDVGSTVEKKKEVSYIW